MSLLDSVEEIYVHFLRTTNKNGHLQPNPVQREGQKESHFLNNVSAIYLLEMQRKSRGNILCMQNFLVVLWAICYIALKEITTFRYSHVRNVLWIVYSLFFLTCHVCIIKLKFNAMHLIKAHHCIKVIQNLIKPSGLINRK